MLRKKHITHKLFNSKGITFKGAFVVVIAIHVAGAAIFYGYIKYQSHRYQIAKQEHELRIQQRDLNTINWNNSNLKLQIVAKPPLKTIVKNTNNSKFDYKHLIKTPTEFVLTFFSKAQKLVNSTNIFLIHQFDDVTKKLQNFTVQNKSNETMFVDKQQKETAWKAAADKYQSKYTQTKKAKLSEAEKRLAKVLEYDKKKAKAESITITVPSSVHRSIPPIKVINPVNTRFITSNNLTINQINDTLTYTSEVNQQTSEVVHTFYSY
jgi:hypothetical protein